MPTLDPIPGSLPAKDSTPSGTQTLGPSNARLALTNGGAGSVSLSVIRREVTGYWHEVGVTLNASPNDLRVGLVPDRGLVPSEPPAYHGHLVGRLRLDGVQRDLRGLGGGHGHGLRRAQQVVGFPSTLPRGKLGGCVTPC